MRQDCSNSILNPGPSVFQLTLRSRRLTARALAAGAEFSFHYPPSLREKMEQVLLKGTLYFKLTHKLDVYSHSVLT